MVPPDPALAPVIPPVIAPIVHAKVLGAELVRTMFGPVPLHVLAVAALVTAGVGFTVTVMVKVDPTHKPVTEVGVTKYCTVPEVALLGFVRAWLMVPPDPALAPVIPPVIAPIVHAKVLGAELVRTMFGPVPLHVLAVAALVTAGVGLTVTVMVKADPTHKPVTDVGVTKYCTVPDVALLGFVNV